MIIGPPHIGVCVCTYKRPVLLRNLLVALDRQKTNDHFTFSVVIVDNDSAQSAWRTVSQADGRLNYRVSYHVEPQQNIALARNRALANAKGEYIAFIDDDECPPDDWLLRLFQACESRGVSGVLAPVRPSFERPPPEWLIKSRVFERPEYPTGTILSWQETRTGNALVRRRAVNDLEPPFRPVYGAGGEDQDFFRRLIECGHILVWCNESPVYEFVPLTRMSLRYICQRALLRGQNERHTLTIRNVAKSAVAALLYAIIMPFLPFFGRHLLVRYLVKFLDHFGKLCAVVGIKPIGDKYLTG